MCVCVSSLLRSSPRRVASRSRHAPAHPTPRTRLTVARAHAPPRWYPLPLPPLDAQGLTPYEREVAARVAANKAKMMSLGLPTLGRKVGVASGSASASASGAGFNLGGSAVGSSSGSAGASGGGSRAPGAFAPVKRKNPEPADKPRPFRIVLRQRVAKVNYADEEGEQEDNAAPKKTRHHKLPRLHAPSTYSALGIRRPAAFQAPPRLTSAAAVVARSETLAGGSNSGAADAAEAAGPTPVPPHQGQEQQEERRRFESLDEKYDADPEAARWAMTMGVRIGARTCV